MRFPQAWASIAKQNSVLRIAVVGVSISGALALIISLRFAFKDPMIIERGCYAKVVAKTSYQEPTKEEFEGFIREALSQRFDSDINLASDYIAIEELRNRDTEQEELRRRNIRQKIIVNSVVKKDDSFFIDSDRVLSVGSLRSAFQFSLVLQLERQARTQGNPYGLVLLKVSGQNQEEGKKNERK